jgi:predicted glycosyltransferase
MRFVVDILHPAHVHFFRNFIGEMERRGHEFLVTARDKEIALELLRAYDIPHRVLSRQARGPGLAAELALRTARLWRLARRFHPDYLLGIMGPTIALAGKALPSRTVIFYDTEMARATNWFSYPLADLVCTPDCYQGDAGPRQLRYAGYHELAYLHPRRFTPRREVLARHGLDDGRPVHLVRFVSWQASHDVGERGWSAAGKRSVVERLAARGHVLVTSEAPLPPDLAPYRSRLPVEDVHHVLAFADLLVGESATMASEAAVLGTHALFVSRTGRGYTDEEERRYGLVHNFTHEQEGAALARIEALLARPDLKADAMRRRELLLADKIDVTGWMVELFENGLAARAA